MDANEIGRTLRCLRQAGDGQGGGVAGEDGITPKHRFGLGGNVRLDVAIFEDRLDDQFAALQQGVVGGRRNARQHGVTAFFLATTTVHFFLQQLGRVSLALFGGSLRTVDEHDVHAGQGRHMRNTRAHHAGTEDAEFLHLPLGHIRGAARELIYQALVHEHGAHEVARHRACQQTTEMLRLDLQGFVERHSAAFVDGRENFLWRRVVAQRHLRNERGTTQHGLRHRRAERIAATRNTETLLVPRRHRLRRAKQPSASAGHHLGGRRQFVHEPQLLRFGRRNGVAVG